MILQTPRPGHELSPSLAACLAAVAVLGVLVAGTFIQPLFHEVDERFHLDMIFTATSGEGYPEVQGRHLAPEVVAADDFWAEGTEAAPLPPRPVGEARDNVCRAVDDEVKCAFKPTFSELEEVATTEGPINRMTQHPPAYYLLVGQAEATLTSLTMRVLPYDGQVWVYRLLSTLLVAFLSLATAAALRCIGSAPSVQVAGALLPLWVPGLTLRSGALVSNDALLVPLISGFLLVLIQMARSGATTRRLIGMGVLLGLALLTKGTAILVAVTVPFCLYLVAPSRFSRQQRVRDTIRSTAVVAGVSLISGGWWVVRNVILYGTPQPAGIRRPDAEPGFVPDISEWVVGYAKGLVRTSFGALGRGLLEVPLLLWLVVAATLVVITFGVRKLGWRLSLALNLPVMLIFVGWTFNSYLSYLRTGNVVAWNARYYFVAMLGICLVVAVGLDAMTRRLPVSTLPAAVLLVSVWATIADAWFWLGGYWAAQGSWRAAWANLSGWAPAPTGILVTAVGCTVLAGTAAVALAARPPRPTHPPTTDMPHSY